ncbi:MAG: pilus assembly protein [Vallitaleaceae bacterium]|nr:pilus assembly protein [Vallitaleaceae bacterium]
MREENGSITIEAALLIPILCAFFLFFIAWFQSLYLQGRMQLLLNDACYELSVDSYLLYELGIIELVDEIYRINAEESIKTEDLLACKTAFEALDFSVLTNTANSLKTDVSMETVLQDFLELSENLGKYGEMATAIGETVTIEGIHLFVKVLTNAYIKQHIEEKLIEEKLNLDFYVSYTDAFLEDFEGNVVISYSIELPFLPGKWARLDFENSSFVKLYKGSGLHYDKYNKEVKLSNYGDNTQNQNTEEKKEEEPYVTVYITKNGTKYHKDENCFHIQVHPYPVNYGLIVKNKEACSQCCHDLSLLEPNTVVFTTKNSSVFHMNEQCRYLYHDLQEMSEAEAIAKNYLPCGSCSCE